MTEVKQPTTDITINKYGEIIFEEKDDTKLISRITLVSEKYDSIEFATEMIETLTYQLYQYMKISKSEAIAINMIKDLMERMSYETINKEIILWEK